MITGAIVTEKPQLVVITGDLVSGAFIGGDTTFDKYYKQMADFFEGQMQPFVWVPGPSDLEAFGPEPRYDILLGFTKTNRFDMTQYNQFKWEKKELYHPFTYDLKIPTVAGDDVGLRIFMFGTGRFDCMGMGGYDCIRRDAVEWFREESVSIPADNKYRANGIAFMHTALQEHMNLVDN